MKIRTKILALGIAPVVFTAAAIIGTVSVQKAGLNRELGEQFDQQAMNECARAAQDVFLMVRSQHELLQMKLQNDLNVASDVLADGGGIDFAMETVPWRAVNQYTKQTSSVSLPRMLAGETSNFWSISR